MSTSTDIPRLTLAGCIPLHSRPPRLATSADPPDAHRRVLTHPTSFSPSSYRRADRRFLEAPALVPILQPHCRRSRRRLSSLRVAHTLFLSPDALSVPSCALRRYPESGGSFSSGLWRMQLPPPSSLVAAQSRALYKQRHRRRRYRRPHGHSLGNGAVSAPIPQRHLSARQRRRAGCCSKPAARTTLTDQRQAVPERAFGQRELEGDDSLSARKASLALPAFTDLLPRPRRRQLRHPVKERVAGGEHYLEYGIRATDSGFLFAARWLHRWHWPTYAVRANTHSSSLGPSGHIALLGKAAHPFLWMRDPVVCANYAKG
uniref:Uncharacterized protein n=1 Tax=Mycena chlorophos TaxID=658473 RepID=A0ABQ0L1P5_MYCCL|nr:predicted protein [Mycena chlorophos]